MQLTKEQWKELALFLKDMVEHPQYQVFDAMVRERFANITTQVLGDKNENKYNRGLLTGRIDQHNEPLEIIKQYLTPDDQSGKEN